MKSRILQQHTIDYGTRYDGASGQLVVSYWSDGTKDRVVYWSKENEQGFVRVVEEQILATQPLPLWYYDRETGEIT